MSGRPAGYQTHLFVCVNERRDGHARGCCASRGGARVRARFKALVAAHGLQGSVRANQSGCLDYCEQGVAMVVYPEGVWYGQVTLADVDRIFEEHVLGGRPLEDKLLRVHVEGEGA